MDLRVPQTLIDNSGGSWILKEREAKDNTLVYCPSDSPHGMVIRPFQVEQNFTKKGRPEPQSKLIQQGKYECAAAALAMLLGESLFMTKRAMAKMQWRNDDRGAGNGVIMGAARILGYDLLPLDKSEVVPGMGACLVSLSSLNMKGMGHAITWSGKEILDPNWNRPGRFFWGTEWSPWTLGRVHCLTLLPQVLSADEREELDLFLKDRRRKNMLSIKESIVAQLNSKD